MKAFIVCLSVVALVFSACSARNNFDPNKKVMRASISEDIKSLDPAVAFDSVSLTVMPLVMESLYQYQYTTRPLKIVPLLADGMPTISNGGKRAVIKLKKGVMFQDSEVFPDGKGRELTAEDFIYSWKRISIPILKSPGHFIFEGKVAGYAELRKKIASTPADKLESVLKEKFDGFFARDKYTIEINLTEAYPQLTYALAMGFTAPVAHEAVAKWGHDGMHRKMVGTGPYMLERYTSGAEVILNKNPNFRGEAFPAELDAESKKMGMGAYAGKTMPFIERVEFAVIKEPQPSWLKFNLGELDIGGIPKDNFDTAIADNLELTDELKAKQITLQKAPQSVAWYLNFNMKDKVVGGTENRNLRAAIAHAIDRNEMIKLFRNNRAIKAGSMIPPTIDGHVKRDSFIGDYDLEKAKELLAKAGYPGGKGLPELVYDLRGSSTPARQMGDYIKKSLAKIGIKIRVNQNTFPGYLEKEKTGNLQVFMGGWQADYPDAENFLQLMYSKNVSPGPNASNWKNAEYDKLYREIARTYPGPERSRLIKKAEDLVLNDYAWAMLWYRVDWVLSHAWMKNYRPSGTINNAIKYYDIDVKKRAKLLKEVF